MYMLNTIILAILNSNLPKQILPGKTFNTDESKSYIKHLLTENLPSSDRKNLASDMKWKFLLDKHCFQKKKIVKKKKTFLTRNQRIELNLLKLPKCGWNYSSLAGLRGMWKEYMKQNLDLVSKAPEYTNKEWSYFSTVLAKSELIGAELTVIQSKVLNQVGMTGTVVLETKLTFNIITPQSKLKGKYWDKCLLLEKDMVTVTVWLCIQGLNTSLRQRTILFNDGFHRARIKFPRWRHIFHLKKFL